MRGYFKYNCVKHVNQASVSSRALARGVPFVWAPPADQERIIAEIEKQFSRLDESVANLKRVKANLKRYKAAVLKAAVGGTLLDSAAAANWPRVRIGNVAEVISGLTKNPKRQHLPRKLPYLRVANVYADELRLDDVEEIGVADSEVEKLLLKRGDMLVVEGNGSVDQIGRVALWDGSIPNCVHQNHLIKVRFEKDVMPHWALIWLLSPGGRREIEQVSSSTSGLHTLSTGKVSRLPLPLPPTPEQHRIVAEVDRRLSIVREVEAEVEANLLRAQALRHSVLSKVFGDPTAI
jgi:type I restriction enzyme S subunit